MYAALASAWNIVGGFSGYISLGHAAFFGVGAYAVGIIFTHTSIGGGYRPFYALPLVGIGVAIASLPIAWVCYRTRAATFAIVTITLLFMTQQLAYNLRSLTNGSQGIAIPHSELPGGDVRGAVLLRDARRPRAVDARERGSSAGASSGSRCSRSATTRTGRAGLGVQTELAKLSSFALSAGLVAMAGGVWAYYISFIYPQFAVDPLVTIGMVLMVYLGGRGTIWGPVLGAFILVPAQQYLAYRLGASELYLVGYSARVPRRHAAAAARDPAVAPRPRAEAARPAAAARAAAREEVAAS